MNKVEEKILEKNLTKYILQVENGYRINLNLLKRDARDLNIELLEFLFDEFKDEYFKMPKEGVWVFEREKFLDFISYKNFLSDSYTRFANKIALCDTEGNSIAQNTDVVLDFPFKDCVLEGGASKDSDKKKEIFFNQTLANEEIDRLFSPKVLHNFSYITQENTDLSVQSDISKIPAFIQSDDLSVSPPPH
ncbi:site-specific DNA-methyltransferase [Helicobacter sp. faydin-H76]|uniref:Site-specific DNA-methyltransferase n=1 Tax=Helicobacter cappadocius TaxID=3063998 RepID=A0AA90T9K0_9HELI|nr:site-specific DNA-methyltransferase [Helicobacter sp. faydin-H76]MDP2538942.1 site-specific DNA-methyltransferase [Helicobacter sp. faydin-H76]